MAVCRHRSWFFDGYRSPQYSRFSVISPRGSLSPRRFDQECASSQSFQQLMGVTCLGAVGFLSSVCLPALSGALFLALRACNFIDHVVHQCRSSWFLQDRSCGVSFGTRLVLFMQAFPFVEVINVVACGLSILHILRNADADGVGQPSPNTFCGLPVVSGMCIIFLRSVLLPSSRP